MKEYINAFHESTHFLADIFLDAEDNGKFYKEYNDYRRDRVNNREYVQHSSVQFFKMEVEQLVFYKIIRDYMKGRWVITVRLRALFYRQIPRYCRPESWEYEQMLKVAAGRVEGFQRGSIQLEFNTQSLNTRGSIVYGNNVTTEQMDKL